MAFKGEVATGNKVYLGIWKIALEGLGTFWDERRVVLSPDSQQWGLVGTEIFLELRIELKVNVVQQSDHFPEIHFVGKAQLHGIPAHHSFHRQRMLQVKGVLIVFPQQLPGCLSYLKTYLSFRC